MEKVDVKVVSEGLAAAFGVKVGDTVKVTPAHAKTLTGTKDAEEIEISEVEPEPPVEEVDEPSTSEMEADGDPENEPEKVEKNDPTVDAEAIDAVLISDAPAEKEDKAKADTKEDKAATGRKTKEDKH